MSYTMLCAMSYTIFNSCLQKFFLFCRRYVWSTQRLTTPNRDILCIENRLHKTQAKSWSRYMLPPWNGICSPERLKWRQKSCKSCKISLSLSSSFWRPTYLSKVEKSLRGNLRKHTVYCTRCASSSCLVGQRISAPKVLSTVTLISAKRWQHAQTIRTCFCALWGIMFGRGICNIFINCTQIWQGMRTWRWLLKVRLKIG